MNAKTAASETAAITPTTAPAMTEEDALEACIVPKTKGVGDGVAVCSIITPP